MTSYSMTKRVEQFRSQRFFASSNVGGRKKVLIVKRVTSTPVQEDALLLDGDTGYLLQETNNKLILDK